MLNSNANNKKPTKQKGTHFLKDDIPKNELTKEHKDYLGMDIPDNYFAASKEDILKNILTEKEPRRTLFGLRPIMAYPIAASILVLVALSLWLPYSGEDNGSKVTEMDIETGENSYNNFSQDDFLINSLFVEDDELNQFLADFVFKEILVEAEVSEQELENVFINSLFIEDSLIINYLDSNLVENVVF